MKVLKAAEEAAREELKEYLQLPTFADRVITVRITREEIHRWKYVYTAEAVDTGTGITARARNYRSKNGAKEHARINLKAILLERGLIRQGEW